MDSSHYVGEYVFTPGEADVPQMFADFIVLRPDGIAMEVRYSKSSGQATITEKHWKIEDSPTARKIIIGDFGHPIEGRGDDIRLFISYDLNEYYQKIR